MELDEFYALARRLPEPFAGELTALDAQIAPHVQEIRLRTGQAVQFTVKGRLCPAGKFLPRAQACRRLDADALQDCFAALCRYSAYAYEQELQQGYFTIPGGNRIGVAGVRGPQGFSCVTSLDLRIARWTTCALPAEVERALSPMRGGILVAGAPGSGKTTLLRSMTAWLGRADRLLCVVDERGELMAGSEGDGGWSARCQADVYTRCPKAEGIAMALRCMNPQIIVCDELGTAADAQAVEGGLACGVMFLASVHSDGALGLAALERKPPIQRLLTAGAFSTVVFLDGRARPGTVLRVAELKP